MWVFIGIGIFMIFMGFGIHKLKWYFLISGYNTMSQERKKNVDVEGLGRLMGGYLYVEGVLTLLAGIGIQLGFTHAITLWVGSFSILTVFLLVKAQKFDGNMYDQNQKLNKRGKQEMILVGVVLMVLFLFMGFVYMVTTRPTAVEWSQTGFAIQGIYSREHSWSEVDRVEMVEKLPTIHRRTNGSEWGSMLKGHFEVDGYGKVMLFVRTDKPPYLYVETQEQQYFLNLEDRKATENLYEIFQNHTKK